MSRRDLIIILVYTYYKCIIILAASTRSIPSGMITSVIRKAKVSASLVLSVDSPESSILVIVLWFGRNSERLAAADKPVSMIFAVFHFW